MSFFHIHVLVVVKYVKYYIDLQVRDYIGVLCLNRHANLGIIYMVSYTNIKGQSTMFNLLSWIALAQLFGYYNMNWCQQYPAKVIDCVINGWTDLA